MSLESFYGGKPGISPIIKKSFKYVREQDSAYKNKTDEEKANAIKNNEVMETCFADPNYTDVWYGELAIIDAENRNNPNHGRLYRRVLNRSNVNYPNTSHAEYIGTLAGPAGGFPQTKIVKFDNFEKNVDPNGASYIYPDSTDSITQGTYESFSNNIQAQTWEVSTDLVSGKDNDEVKYYWVNVVNENTPGEEKNTIYLGFKIPYPVFDFDIKSTDWTNDFSAERIDEQDHPFYTNTKLSIPIGVKGDRVGNFRKETIANSDNPVYNPVYLYENFWFDNQGLLKTNETGNPVKSNNQEITPINNNSDYTGKQVWVYDFTAYGKFQDDTTCKEFTCYLGEIKEIENITVTDEGIIQIKYLNDKAIPINNGNPIKYIADTSYDSDSGIMTINYNIEEESDTFKIPGIKRISIDNNGKVSYRLTTSSEDKDLTERLSFVKGIDIDRDTKEVSIVKTTETESTGIVLQSIEGIEFDKQTGNLTIKYNTRKNGQQVTKTIENFRPPLKSAEIAAELYTDLLRAIAIFQEEYYDSQYINQTWLNYIKKIKTESPPISIVQTIVNGDWNNPEEEGNHQSFWFLERKYFADSSKFNDLKNELNSECKEETNDLGIVIDEYFDFYPYNKGQISFFQTNNISSWDDLESEDDQIKHNAALAILNLEGHSDPDRTGQLLYYKSNAFYYDGNKGQWKHAGTWSSAADKSHIQILQYDVNGEPKPIDTNFDLSDAGFYFEQRQVLPSNEDGILLKEFLNED